MPHLKFKKWIITAVFVFLPSEVFSETYKLKYPYLMPALTWGSESKFGAEASVIFKTSLKKLVNYGFVAGLNQTSHYAEAEVIIPLVTVGAGVSGMNGIYGPQITVGLWHPISPLLLYARSSRVNEEEQQDYGIMIKYPISIPRMKSGYMGP